MSTTHKIINEQGQEISKDDYDNLFSPKIREKWNQHKSDYILLEVLTGLQASLQNVCENLVLLDRVEFLKENGFQCSVRKLTNDVLSPRCYALIVLKNTP